MSNLFLFVDKRKGNDLGTVDICSKMRQIRFLVIYGHASHVLNLPSFPSYRNSVIPLFHQDNISV